MIVLGAGGHARLVVEAWCLAGGAVPTAFFDDDPEKLAREIDGILVKGAIASAAADADQCALLGVGAIQHPGNRLAVLGRVETLGLRFPFVVHPAASVSGASTIGMGSVVLARATINRGAELGAHCTVYTGAIVEHDCVLGDHTQIAPAACICGGVRTGQRVFVGAGATVLQGIVIGDDAVIGAGAVVVSDVPSGTTVVGIPARPVNRTR